MTKSRALQTIHFKLADIMIMVRGAGQSDAGNELSDWVLGGTRHSHSGSNRTALNQELDLGACSLIRRPLCKQQVIGPVNPNKAGVTGSEARLPVTAELIHCGFFSMNA